MQPINIADKFALFNEHWRPKIVASLNGQDVKLVKVQGIFPWHQHTEAKEMFLVWRGRFRVEFRDHVADMGPGEFVVVPRGVEHRTVADEEAEVLIFEPVDVVNTGEVRDDKLTAPQDVESKRHVQKRPITFNDVRALHEHVHVAGAL